MADNLKPPNRPASKFIDESDEEDKRKQGGASIPPPPGPDKPPRDRPADPTPEGSGDRPSPVPEKEEQPARAPAHPGTAPRADADVDTSDDDDIIVTVTEADDPNDGVKPMTLRIPESDRGSQYSEASTLSPRTPAEKVRFILADRPDDDFTSMDSAAEIDLHVHSLFCQMDVLCHFDDGETGWKEAARWLKYEEKVEAGDRWSKPHVSTTSLHALFEIRKGIAENNTAVILDMEATHGCMHQVAEMIVEQLVKDKDIPAEKAQRILDALLTPHKHQHRNAKKSKDEVKSKPYDHRHSTPKKDSKSNKLEATFEDADESTRPLTGGDDDSDKPNKRKKKKKLGQILKSKRQDSAEISALRHKYPHTIYPKGLLPEDLMPYKPNKRLMKKIPGGSEVANILIGQVEFLDEPIVVFVRLAKSAVLSDLSEVNIPTRFLFLVLGPPEATSLWEYDEVGRAMAALFSDKVFSEVSYKANSRQDLIDGIDEFIDDLTVLPPSIWDPSTRLEPPEQTRSEEKIRRRLLDSARHAAGEEAFHFAESAGEDNTLQRTGRLFGGLIADIKRRYPMYWSDIKDACHMQCIASVVFLYFACITPIVTFGGLLGDATDGYMGTMETMFSGAICGLIYHLFAGQPLTIMGATGPLLVFESILYGFCKSNELDFLSFRFWIGAWVTFILLMMVAFDLSALVRYITRFTEESFAVLISLIFIAEAFKKLAAIYVKYPIHTHVRDEGEGYRCHCEHPPAINGSELNVTGSDIQSHKIWETYNWSTMVYEDCITYQGRIVVDNDCINETQCLDHDWLLVGPACNVDAVTHSVPDVFFLCCFLFIGTFVIAIFFRNFRNSPFFPSIVRSTVSDFSVLIAIVTCTGIDAYLALATPKLLVPEEVKTTREGRGWFVNIMPKELQDKWWLILVALVPALLATILIFLDQQITAVIVNRKEHKLKKGPGYHLDLLILAVLIAICSFMGLPWFVAATVRTVTHVRSLIRESELKAPGERSQMLGVREQRVTGFCIHLLIAGSVLLTGILKNIPMAVLYGVFLYMGVTSLSGVQFVQRILILIMPGKYQPDYIYLRHVETNRVHVFTLIQIACMVLMWVVKSINMVSLAFPIMILALCFIRKALDWIFTQSELYWLDHILPEEKRRKKEDDALDLEGGSKAAEAALPETGDDPPMEDDEWKQLVAKRDYGVGRKVRPRKLSVGIIKRYQDRHKPEHGEDSDEEAEDAEHPAYGTAFRDRKFSL